MLGIPSFSPAKRRIQRKCDFLLVDQNPEFKQLSLWRIGEALPRGRDAGPPVRWFGRTNRVAHLLLSDERLGGTSFWI